MPYRDPNRAREYFRNYRRTRRSGDACSTPVHPVLSPEFRLATAADVVALIEDQCQAVLDEKEATILEKARCLGYLATVSLKAIEAGNLAARIEELEAILKKRKPEGSHPR